jgi:NAD(P)-dependent dehydrogenase (short-subunit alcohol dehydrogenase family)
MFGKRTLETLSKVNHRESCEQLRTGATTRRSVRHGIGGSAVTGRAAGRVAVVTGAAAGLGRVFCCALAAEGAVVAGLDIADMTAVAEEVTAAGGTFVPVVCDITDADAVATAAGQVRTALGTASILVNNAGIYPLLPFAETDFATWRRVHGLNVDGTFLVTKAFLPGMLELGWGRVVNIVSAVVFLGPPGMVAYTASKSALVGMTRSLASEIGASGVTVNAIAPGLTRTATAMNSAVAADLPRVVDSQAIPRAEEPEDLVSTLLYVCDEGSAFLTGQTINVDGGFAKH